MYVHKIVDISNTTENLTFEKIKQTSGKTNHENNNIKNWRRGKTTDRLNIFTQSGIQWIHVNEYKPS